MVRNNSLIIISKMTKSRFSLRNVVKIGVACLAVCMMFSSCGKESSDKKITAFSFSSPSATGVIDEKAKTIIVEVPNETNVTALVPTIAVSEKATVSPASGVAQNFTSPVTYTVTAEDGSTADYKVTVKKGTGGGDDGLFKDAKFSLPKNVRITYECTAGGITTSTVFIRIGNNFYRDTEVPDLGNTRIYLKHTGTNWQRWEHSRYGGWNHGETLDAEGVIEEIGGYGNNMLNFMTFDARYVAISGRTKDGTEAVAGVMCDKYVIADRTLYHSPVFNLFLKDVWSPAIYEVKSWDTTVTSFGGIDLP